MRLLSVYLVMAGLFYVGFLMTHDGALEFSFETIAYIALATGLAFK